MADKKWLVNLDLDQNELKNITLHPLAAVPVATGEDGQLYYNTGTQLTYQYKAGATNAWEVIGGSGTTNLGTGTHNSTDWEITSSSGSNITLTEATVSLSGLMSASHWSIVEALDDDFIRWDTANLLSGGTGPTQAAWFLDEDDMISNSDQKTVSQQSLVAYVASQVAGGVTYKGGFDPTANTGDGDPDLDTITSETGDMYTVTVAGTYNWTTGSAVLEVGDVLIAESDGVLNDVADWTVVQKNETGVVTNVTGGTDDQIAVFDGAGGQVIKDGGVTIASLQSPDATETVAGLVEEATQAEVNNGDASGSEARLFVNPAKLRSTLGITADLITTVKYEEEIGTGALTSIPVTHSIGRQRVQVSVTTTAAPYDEVECRVEHTSTTVTTFIFNTAPTTNEYTVTIIG